MRHCDESGLFQELESNPFDHDFQKVTGSSGKQQQAQQEDEQTGLVVRGQEKLESGGEAEKKDAGVSTVTMSTTTPPVSVVSQLQTVVTTAIPVAPPPNLVNPEKVVSYV